MGRRWKEEPLAGFHEQGGDGRRNYDGLPLEGEEMEGGDVGGAIDEGDEVMAEEVDLTTAKGQWTSDGLPLEGKEMKMEKL